MITLEQFLAGAPLAYRSFDGAAVSATWRKSPAPHLIIRDANGRQLMAPLMPRQGAESFYAGIAADPSAWPLDAAGQVAA